MYPSTLDIVKTIAEIFVYVSTGVVALWGLYTYRRSTKLERARWLKELYEKFYERSDLKKIRDLLDRQDPVEVASLVNDEPSEFTDYLNFFEFLGYLLKRKQITESDLLDLFEYYLRRLEENPAVCEYVMDPQKGYERIGWLFSKVSVTNLIFVYGTLMKGFDSVSNWQTKFHAKLQGTGKIKASLYDLGDFPGAIQEEKSSKNYVTGEVYALRKPEDGLKVLDEYEEFFPRNPRDSLFVRKLAKVELSNGITEEAWVYFYNKSVAKEQHIQSGTYRKEINRNG